jgi:hypothetical protein
MPTYRNDGSTPVRWKDAVFEPGVETEVSFFVPQGAYPALTKTADAPLVASPVLFTGAVAGEMILPYAPRIVVSSEGSGTIYFADDQDGVVVTGAWTTLPSPWEKLGKIRVEGSLHLTVERVE